MKKTKKLTIICYGNILRSQVLEQYLRHYALLWDIKVELSSAGIASKEEFPNKKELFGDISEELSREKIKHTLHRNPWDGIVEKSVIDADIVLCADNSIKMNVISRSSIPLDIKKIYTFYEFINEGEKDFEDTYDYEENRQDPIKFSSAFSELERIAKEMLLIL